MRGIISQRLIPTVDGKRAAAIEILTGSPRVKDLIREGHIEELKEAMEGSAQYGMQTFDDALLSLYQAGKISEDETIKNADSPNNLRLKIKNANGFEAKTEFTLQVEESEEDDEEDDEFSSSFDDNNGVVYNRSTA